MASYLQQTTVNTLNSNGEIQQKLPRMGATEVQIRLSQITFGTYLTVRHKVN